MKRLFFWLFLISIIYTFSSCKTGNTTEEEITPVVSVKTELIKSGIITDEISFNGSTVYLKKNQVISPISGYVVSSNASYGQKVEDGIVLFELKTRESKVLESAGDISRMSGTVEIRANSDGFINELNVNETGLYVTEGSILCNIVNTKDLMIRLNVPYEYISVLGRQKNCKIRLADQTVIAGTVFRILPSVEESTQTQIVLIKPEKTRLLPENLNLILNFINIKHDNALLVSKSSLMTNETQSEFWVMKIDSGDIAVKVPVKKGLENDSISEIISSELKVNDMIISIGAYGLPDSTIVSIVK